MTGAYIEVDGVTPDRLSEAVPWIDAIVNATAEAGKECGLRVYENGGYEWWPTDGTDPHDDGHSHSHYRAFHKAVVICEPLRPSWVKLAPAALAAIAGMTVGEWSARPEA